MSLRLPRVLAVSGYPLILEQNHWSLSVVLIADRYLKIEYCIAIPNFNYDIGSQRSDHG